MRSLGSSNLVQVLFTNTVDEELFNSQNIQAPVSDRPREMQTILEHGFDFYFIYPDKVLVKRVPCCQHRSWQNHSHYKRMVTLWAPRRESLQKEALKTCFELQQGWAIFFSASQICLYCALEHVGRKGHWNTARDGGLKFALQV